MSRKRRKRRRGITPWKKTALKVCVFWLLLAGGIHLFRIWKASGFYDQMEASRWGSEQKSAQVSAFLPAEKAMKELRAFMFEHVYNNKRAKSEEGKAENLVITLYQYYLNHFDLIPDELKILCDKGDPKEQVVCDYISAMTDRFAIATYEEIYIPKCWHG